MIDKTRVINGDCLVGMKEFPDKHFDLAIVDPPYGINGHKQRIFDDGKVWDTHPPDEQYFWELVRVSKNQIIWGANHFLDRIPFSLDSPCWIVWDKHQPEGISFAMIEMAWTSFTSPAKLYFTKPAGERGFYTVDAKRIHPTQKPIKLYKWLLKNYAKEGDKILDTHLGSGSSRIAAFDMGFDFTGYELDKDYFEAGNKRFAQHKAQLKLFA